jgi:hypothetical protein
MLCLSGTSLLFGFVSLFSCFSIVLWALYQYVCIVWYTFNNFLTTLFDVCCMCYLDQFVVCVLRPPNGWIHQNVHLYPPPVLSIGPHFRGVTTVLIYFKAIYNRVSCETWSR